MVGPDANLLTTARGAQASALFPVRTFFRPAYVTKQKLPWRMGAGGWVEHLGRRRARRRAIARACGLECIATCPVL
eukprot:6187775-Pleurochrysis_carterae.AAC.1